MGIWAFVPSGSWAAWLFYPLLLLTLWDSSPAPPQQHPPTTLTLPPQDSCETKYDGITYCVADDGDIHVIVVDLENPYLRFEMVMADDVTGVETDRRERIEEMVTRPPYEDQQVVVAINADYFGHAHGPEGLTVKNGRRLDLREPLSTLSAGPGDGGENPNALWRSSLALSRFNRVSLGRKTAGELRDPRAYREHFYNAVGGGPLILNQGVILPNAVACLVERFPVGACRRTIQTAAGLSRDGRRLFLAAGKGRDIEGFAELLRDYGAFTAIKLDGGGSSQLWYDGRMRHDTERAVGNALFLFYSPVPRHDARVLQAPSPLVVESGQQISVSFEIQNTGFLDWEPDLGYRLRNVQGWPVLRPAFWRLPEPVPADGSLPITLTILAPWRSGVCESEWQLVHRTEPIGPRLWFSLVVVPPGAEENGFGARVRDRLAQGQARATSVTEWATVRQELERMIQQEVEAELRLSLCRGNHDAQIRRGWWAPLLRPLAC